MDAPPTQLSLLHLQLQEPTKTSSLQSSPTTTTTTTTSRGRKPKKCPPRKKHPPQRGMGVAQLERLRLQERWKMITESNNQLDDSLNLLQPSSASSSSQLLQPLLLSDHPFASTTTTVPLQYYGSGSVNNNNVNGSHGGAGLPAAMIANAVVGGGGGGFNNRGGHFSVNPYYALGSPVQVGTSAVVFETSKELSSMPKLMQQQQCGNNHSLCDVCFKKKRFSGEGVGYINGRIGKPAEISPTNGPDFQGLITANNTHFNGEMMAGFSTRAARSANHNINKGVLVEYDFFSRNSSGKGNSFKEMEFAAEASVAVGNSDYTGYGAYNASNYVDLSLKL